MRRATIIPILLVGAVTAAIAQPVPDVCRDAFYSPATTHYVDTTIFTQQVYSLPGTASIAGDAPFGPFVPVPNRIDATCVINENVMRFSVARNGYLDALGGIFFAKHDEIYRATRSPAGVVVELDPDWAALGLDLSSIDAVHSDGTCFSFSVAGLERHPDGGFIRPWQVHRACPGQPLELLFDAGASFRARNVDAVHVDGDVVEFSTSRDHYLPGGVRVWNESTYRCVPSGPRRTCGPADLSTGLDGVAIGIDDLEAFSEGDGLPCDDDDPCTQDDVCIDLQCNGDVTICEQDDNVCTVDACDPTTGQCVPSFLDGPCDDGDACTVGDECDQGQCVPIGPVECEEHVDPCVASSCNPATGQCESEPLSGTPCDDNLACTEQDTCNAGTCEGTPVVCSQDDNVCTESLCDETTGQCVSTNLDGAPCTDDNACTLGDSCRFGTCLPTVFRVCNIDPFGCTASQCDPATGQCENTPLDGISCDDGLPCTDQDTCNNGTCEGIPVTCAQDTNPCSISACDASTGACIDNPAPNGFPCDDGDPCTINDICSTGQCTGVDTCCGPSGSSCGTGADCCSGKCDIGGFDRGGGICL